MPQHPLQRLKSPSPYFSLLFHILGVASFSYNFHFLTLWDTPFTEAYGWHFQFLTIIGLLASLVSFQIAILADLTQSSSLFKAKNIISILATPLEVLISILYWAIQTIDPELLFQGDIRLPFLTDLGFHFAPAVFLTLDLVLLSPPWTVPTYGVMTLSTVLAFSYWYWVELCFKHNGSYPYPLFGLLSTTQRVLLFTFSASLTTASSVLLKWIYARMNGYSVIAEMEAHKPLKKIK